MTGTEGAAAEVTAETHTVEAAAVVAGPTGVPICTVEDLLPGAAAAEDMAGVVMAAAVVVMVAGVIPAVINGFGYLHNSTEETRDFMLYCFVTSHRLEKKFSMQN